MPPFSEVEFALDQSVEPRAFENLCVDLLIREGYRRIVPGGGKRDHGRDAECRFWEGDKGIAISLAFQFSLEKTWERKLRRDIPTIAKHCPTAKGVVFVTSQYVSVEKQDKMRVELEKTLGWYLCIYDRGWLRARLEELHQDLARKYLDVSPPETVCHAETLIDLNGLDDDSAKEIFRTRPPQHIKATLVSKTQKQPNDSNAWKCLAALEYHLRDYKAALKAATRALAIAPDDINIKMLRAAVLAEQGLRTHSKILLIQAKDVFLWVVDKLNRGYKGHVSTLDITSFLHSLFQQKDAINWGA